MSKTISLRVTPQTAATEAELLRAIGRELRAEPHTISAWRIRKKSIDARRRAIMINLTIEVYLGSEQPPATAYTPIHYPDVKAARPVIVVGAGPGGYFAALRLIELGLRPILLERGKDVDRRRKDIALIPRQGIIDPESNYSFGEGGAGAFSDGKLYTRSKKRGSVDKILGVFCRHGADESIMHDAHPHIGTDRLPVVIRRMRETIEASGGQVIFDTLVSGMLYHDQTVCGVRTADGRLYQGPVILATGHSARDVYRFLHADGIDMEAKTLAVGVRIEHPAVLIDRLQYHNLEGRGQYLPAAEYSYVAQAGERGVYSFCMCPGGFIVPAATGSEQVVVNGMSPANRGSKWSNSGMVVELRPEDLAEASISTFMAEAMGDEAFAAAHPDYAKPDNPLRMMHFQEALERMAWLQGGRTQRAPAQRMTDFVHGRLSYDLPRTSYPPGVVPSPRHFWLPKFISSRLAEGFREFGRKSRGFLTHEAVMLGVESRTSSPVRIPRHHETLTHTHYSGLYPCGEGAGYAGGIVSAAIDGERCAEAVAAAMG